MARIINKRMTAEIEGDFVVFLTGSNGNVGIWHETFRVAAGQYETVYNNMPEFGLGKAGMLVPAAGRKSTAVGRIQAQRKEDALTE
jgi:hypothetical protein